jgi:hypothetical protein
MARKGETGIDYFPLNVDIVYNQKVKLVMAELGASNTLAVLVLLYCKIYREKGYWVDWFNKDCKLLFASDECKVELSVVDKVVEELIKRSFFDTGLFEKFGILTSDRIQENYLEATKRRKKADLIDDFLLLKKDDVYESNKNVNIIDLNVNILSKKVDISTQSKERVKKERKGERDKASLAPTHDYSDEEKKRFAGFTNWILTNAPRVAQMKEPFTIKQCLLLDNRKYKLDTIKALLIKMSNWTDLHKKRSAYMTFLDWHKKEEN